MSSDPAARRNQDWALFLDVDGTLLEIAETPDGVIVPERLMRLLPEVEERLGGALALVSGRSIADLDRLFSPLRLCAAGVHGCERRLAGGAVIRPTVDAERVDEARRELATLAAEDPGLKLEDKDYALAMHFRLAPHFEARVRERMHALCERLGQEFTLQAGKCVFEVRPAACTKGKSIAALLAEPPFRGRTPVFIGDDVTDEDGFAEVNAREGVSIKVGAAMAPTRARHRLRDVTEVIDWLEHMPPPALERLAKAAYG